MYENDSNIRTPTGDNSQWERNLTVSHVVQYGPLKDLSIAQRHASLHTEMPAQRDSDEHRF